MWALGRRGSAGRVWCGCAASNRPHQPRSARASLARDQPLERTLMPMCG
jgi:hypothetical protein